MALLDHEGGVEFPYRKEDVLDAIVEALSQVEGIEVSSVDKLAGRVVAKAGMSLMSWGENIPISLVEISPGRTRVSVISTPKTGVLFGGAFDLGKNRRNIEKILSATSAVLGRKPQVEAPTTPPSVSSPTERLMELKNLLSADLITEEEFNRRKGEILSEI